MSTQADRWRMIMQVFDAAAELPPEERRAFVESRTHDSAIEATVLALLEKLEGPAPESPPEFTKPERVGRYVVVEQLGRGGAGTVYSARDPDLGRLVALKFLTPEMLGGHSGIDRLIREAKILSALNHPNIVTIHEVIHSEWGLAIVMELVDGKPIRPLCSSPASPREVAQIGQQIAHALSAAHGRGIIHRDIKPDNVLLRPDGYVKVLDFGLARRLGSDTNTTTAGLPAGTVRYMSPEQTRGEELSGATDVFSLGLMLYELATGRHPFGANSVFETAHRIATVSPAPPSSVNSGVPEQMEKLILSMLAKDPAVRPSAAEVALLLDQNGGAAEPRKRLRKGVSRRWMVGAGAAAASLGGMAALWRAKSSNRPPVQVLLDDGEVDHPVFSPDGSHVAFTWKPAGEDVFKLALIAAGGGPPRVLTSGRVNDVDPIWAPDGQRLCFVRQGLGENALYVTTIERNVEQRITTLHNSALMDRIDWLPDNRTVAVSENWYTMPIFLIDVESGERRKLPSPPEGSSDDSPKCSPDGRWIVFRRSFGHTSSDLFLVGVSGGGARRLTFDGAAKVAHDWTPDGKGVLFKARVQNRWRFLHVTVAGTKVKEVALPEFASGSFDVRAGRDGGLDVINAHQYQVASISRMEIPAAAQSPSTPVRMIASESRGMSFDCNPAVSPDGLQLAFISTRTGCPEIWVSNSEGWLPRQMTSFAGPEISQPAWSPDGRYLLSAAAPEGSRNLFLIDVASGSLRWLTFGGKEETEPQWSRDGRWITFASSRSGRQELWRMPAAGGPARRLTHNGAAVHRESPDGRWIYYVRHEQPGLWRMPWDGGKEELVLERVSSELYRAWAVGRQGIYYTYKNPAAPKWTVLLYDPASRAERAVAVFEHPPPRWSGALAVSPDERWMLLPMVEARGSRLVLFSSVQV